MTDKPVFYDATGRRAFGASVVGWTAGIVSLLLGAVFVVSLVNAPTGARPHLPGHARIRRQTYRSRRRSGH